MRGAKFIGDALQSRCDAQGTAAPGGIQLRGYLLVVLAATVVSATAVAVTAETFSGHVVKVLDGDTIEVLRRGHARRVRLVDIDCPEWTQAYGQRAKDATVRFALHKTVSVKETGHDVHGRILGEVTLPDGRNLNRELVAAGLAWRYPHDSIDRDLAALEAQARAARRGLWAGAHPVPPWEFRRRERTPEYAPRR
jgi:endonuclease YncB( thermonuclease family)